MTLPCVSAMSTNLTVLSSLHRSCQRSWKKRWWSRIARKPSPWPYLLRTSTSPSMKSVNRQRCVEPILTAELMDGTNISCMCLLQPLSLVYPPNVAPGSKATPPPNRQWAEVFVCKRCTGHIPSETFADHLEECIQEVGLLVFLLYFLFP